MRSRENDITTQSTVRKALETVLFRTDDRTVIKECRHCGTTLESVSTCPACGSSDIVEYRIQ